MSEFQEPEKDVTNPYASPVPVPSDEPQVFTPPPAAEKSLQGLGGWLILVGIGLVITPIGLLAFLATNFVPIFTDGTWEALTTPGAPNYAPFWGPVILFEVLCNLVFMGLFSWLVVLYFMKSRSFPKHYIWIRIANTFFVVGDVVVLAVLLPAADFAGPDTIREVMVSIVGTAIWVPYMLKSVRVKNTFVN